jgi:hypothetical protein
VSWISVQSVECSNGIDPARLNSGTKLASVGFKDGFKDIPAKTKPVRAFNHNRRALCSRKPLQVLFGILAS